MKIYNPVFADPERSIVRLEIDHSTYGRIPTCMRLDGSDADTPGRKKLHSALSEVEIGAYVEPVISDEEARAVASNQRDLLLSKTDWYLIRQVETGDAVPAEVLEYRQALRDITQQSGYPQLIEWPVLDA